MTDPITPHGSPLYPSQEVVITQSVIDAAVEVWDETMPTLAGLLDAEKVP